MKLLKKMGIIVFLLLLGVSLYCLYSFEIVDMTIATSGVEKFNTGWELIREDGSKKSITLPYKEDSKANRVVYIENTIPKEYWGKTLSFPSADKLLEVYVDENRIYEFGVNDKRIFGKTPGSIYNFIDIPFNLEQGNIRIKMYSPYDDFATNICEMEIGDKTDSVLNLLKRNLFSIFCNVVILLVASLYGILWCVQRGLGQKSYGMGYLSMYLFLMCCFYFIETKALAIFYGNSTFFSIMIFVILMLFPILLSLYFHNSFKYKDQKTVKMILALSYLNIAMQLLFQLTNKMDFMEMSVVSYGLIFLTILVYILKLLQRYRRNKVATYILELISLICLGIGMLIDIVRNSMSPIVDMGKYGRIGMTLFAILTVMIHLQNMMGQYTRSMKRNNKKLQEQMELLEHNNKELKVARKEADAANEAKSKFLANMSHEIRTPINTIMGLNEIILKESEESTTKEYAMGVKNASNSLLGIINDVLDLSKIESGKMALVPVEYDLCSMVYEVINIISVRVAEKGLRLDLAMNPELPCKLYGDDVKLRQILVNLLTNAVKYTHEGGVKLIVDGKMEQDNLRLYVAVEDTGIGIKEEDIEKLFVAFERIEESRNRSIEGTGLGMNITMQFIKMMDGELKVYSEYGKGSVFSFEIMQKVVDRQVVGNFAETFEERKKETITSTVKFRAPKAKILVVDDNMMNRKVFFGLLKHVGMHIDEAASGMECLEKVKKEAYQLIFLDHMMPEMDGIETLHRLKEMTDNKCVDAKIICLTANAIAGAKEQYMKEGFDAYLSKPIIPEKLQEIIRESMPEEFMEYYQENEGKEQNIYPNIE